MKRIVRVCSGAARKLAWMLLAAALADTAARAKTEETYPLLRTRTATYTNVTVTTKDKTYVFILHSGGMGSIKIADLPNETQEQLGYIVPVDPALAAKTNRSKFSAFTSGTNSMAVFAREMAGLGDKFKPLEEEWRGRMEQANIQITPPMMYGGLAVLFVLYLFLCYCSHLICVKAAGSSSILVWVPIFQLIPLFRAAGMSGWWFLISFIPITPIVWAVKIVRTRKKSLWTSFFLLLPPTTLFAFMYLAFSAVPKPTTPRYKSMALAAV
jgi:hypothetical protein